MVLGRNDRFNEEWLLGAMPMANVFVAFWLVRIRDPEWWRFRLGFQAFGAVAVSLYLAGMWLYPDMTGLHFRLLSWEAHGEPLTALHELVWDTAPPAIVSFSQLLAAVVGGRLFQKIKIR